MKIAMVVPPISDLNTLYSAAPRLTAWLRQLGHEVEQIDLSLELCLHMFSRPGLERLFAAVDPRGFRGESEDAYLNRDRYLRIVDDVVCFLQGRDQALAHLIVRGDVVPEGPNFRDEPPRARRASFGTWGKVDLARYLATLMLYDLGELFKTISPHFGFVHYAEKLATSKPSFDGMAAELARPPNLIETMMEEVAERTIGDDVDLVCMTCPFPGMLMGSLIIGRWLAARRPRARRALGGGFPSTELRRMSDPRLFDFIDYLVLDDGEVPLERICARIAGADVPLHRTYTRADGRVVWNEDPGAKAPRFRDLPAPDYTGYRLERHLHLLTSRDNPFHRLLNEGPWLKLTAAHGCYWKKCTFCDIHLAYIEDFDPLPARALADQMDALHAQTGLSSFHFTDEAAPPPLLVNLAIELLRRGRCYQYWGNIRYDTGFTPDRCRLLAASGMIAVTGGIEVASDELLPKIEKGITVPQVIKVLQAFAGAGILTHAYLIYGFPGETPQDTINSLDIVRQLMRARLLSSGFFHKFSLTAHSPVGKRPQLFGIRVTGPQFAGFSHYNLDYESETVPAPDDRTHMKLLRALAAFTRGEKLDGDIREFFDGGVPAPTVAPDLVERTMRQPHPGQKPGGRLCWLGGVPRWSQGLLNVSCDGGELYTALAPKGLADDLARCHPSGWKEAPPVPADFASTELLERMHGRGLVLV